MGIDIYSDHLRKHASGFNTDRVVAIVKDQLEQDSTFFPARNIDVHVSHASRWPEAVSKLTGIGGYAPDPSRSQGNIWLYIDPQNPTVRDNKYEPALRSASSHETHHAHRWFKPGYGRTLGEHFVTEGLAQVFELQRGHTSFIQTITNERHISPAKLPILLEKAFAERNTICTDHNGEHGRWFYGIGEKPEPNLAGYAVGLALAHAWLKKTGITAADAVNLDAKIILDEWTEAKDKLVIAAYKELSQRGKTAPSRALGKYDRQIVTLKP